MIGFERIKMTWRYQLVLMFFAVCLSALIFRAVDLHVFEQEFLAEQGDARAIRFERLDAHRGMITDRHGDPLAVSAPVETVYADPAFLSLGAADLVALAKALDVSGEWLAKKIEHSKGKRFVYLKRKMAPHEVQKVLALNLDGIYSQREYKRYYPGGEVAAHVLGFTNIDDQGQEGLELAYDKWLTGKAGKKGVLKNRKGKVIRDFGEIQEAEPGRNIKLSLDMRIQYLAYRELKAAVETHRAKAGSLIILDVKTGEILAMVNQPSYNPNNRSTIDVAHLRNRALTDVFEPGSTMKLATVAAALESKKYSLNTMLNTSPGFLRLGNKSIRDSRNYGELSLLEIVAKSSNVGTSKIALDLTGSVVWDMLYRLGLGQNTGVSFPGESLGQLPDSGYWPPIKVATMSYGYGMSVNALQLAKAYMILANGGVSYPLSLIYRESPPAGEQVLDEAVSAAIRVSLKAAVALGGTGTRAIVPMYEVGGKSGTVHNVGRYGYEQGEYKAIFAGVAPIAKPQIAMVVMIDAPAGAEYYGGEVAAPIFSRVVDGAMRLLNVAPDKGVASAEITRTVIGNRG